MNKEERQQYNSLSEEEREVYDRIKEMKPYWSHEYIMAKLAIIMDEDDEDEDDEDEEERQHYNSLSKEEREEYDRIKEMKPHWSHNQIMTKLAVNIRMDKSIEQGNEDVDANDPIWWKQILTGSREFLRYFGGGTFYSTAIKVIDDALSTLGNMISKGIRKIGDFIDDLFNSIF